MVPPTKLITSWAVASKVAIDVLLARSATAAPTLLKIDVFFGHVGQLSRTHSCACRAAPARVSVKKLFTDRRRTTLKTSAIAPGSISGTPSFTGPTLKPVPQTLKPELQRLGSPPLSTHCAISAPMSTFTGMPSASKL